MKALITTCVPTSDEQAVTFTLASTGPLPREEMARLYDLFRSSVVVELEVGASDQTGRLALAAPVRSEER